MTHASLFSGIGGFDLAAEWAGWTNAFNCEIDSFCRKVLKYHFPDAEQYEDIKKSDFSKWRDRIDVLTGGFPCQPFSLAGKRKGTDDDRYLWPAMLGVIRTVRPRWVVGENVYGIVNWSDGLVFDTVCSDLEAAGYEVQPYIIPACGVGAPHRRDRVWFVAHYKDDLWQRDNCRFRELRVFEPMEVEATQERICVQNGSDYRRREEVENDPYAQANCRSAEGGGGGSHESQQVRQQEREFTYSVPLGKFTQQEERVRSSETQWKEQMVCPNLHQESENPFRVLRHEGRSYERETNSEEELRTFSHRADTRIETMREGQDSLYADEFVAHADVQRFEKCNASEKSSQTQERLAQNGNEKRRILDWSGFPTESPVCDRDDGFPGELAGLSFPAWCRESIKACGNAIVPQVAWQIFKTIEEYETKQLR